MRCRPEIRFLCKIVAGMGIAMLIAELIFLGLLFIPYITSDLLSWVLPLVTVAFFGIVFLLPKMIACSRSAKGNASICDIAFWYFAVALLIAFFAPERYPYFEWTLTFPWRRFILIEGVLGGAIALSGMSAYRRVLLPVACGLCLAINVVLCVWFFSPGSWSGLKPDSSWGRHPFSTDRETIDVPKEIPPLYVAKFYYGSGEDRRRAYYRDSVSIITPSVDARAFGLSDGRFDDFARRCHWGFDASAYPLNGVLYLPSDTTVKAPLVLVAHGNRYMQKPSEAGFEYLGYELARRGYAVALIDENFINRNLFGDFHGKEIPLRAWLILKHLEEIGSWASDEKNNIGRRIDTQRIALLGHSRGGEAVAMAVDMNGGKFPIKGIVQLAPTANKKRHGKDYAVDNVDYLLIVGGRDSDIFTLEGKSVYNRVKFTDEKEHFKSLQYLYSASHSGFNSAWDTDWMVPYSFLLEQRDLMAPQTQRDATVLYVSHFLNASLNGDSISTEALADNRWLHPLLPADYRLSSFRDSRFIEIGSTDSIAIEWPGDTTYSIDLSSLPATAIPPKSCLTFDVTTLSPGNCDFTIALVSADGTEKAVALSDFYVLPPRLDVKFNKIDKIHIARPTTSYPMIGQTVNIPFPDNFDHKPIAIKFRFDHTPSGKILITGVGVNERR